MVHTPSLTVASFFGSDRASNPVGSGFIVGHWAGSMGWNWSILGPCRSRALPTVAAAASAVSSVWVKTSKMYGPCVLNAFTDGRPLSRTTAVAVASGWPGIAMGWAPVLPSGGTLLAKYSASAAFACSGPGNRITITLTAICGPGASFGVPREVVKPLRNPLACAMSGMIPPGTWMPSACGDRIARVPSSSDSVAVG